MNILLVLPNYNDRRKYCYVPNIGIGYISSSLKKAGFNVVPLNLALHEGEEPEALLRDAIERNDIDIVGTSGAINTHKEQRELVDLCKKIKPEIVAVIGGALVTYSPAEAMTLIPNADYGVIGEGEITVCELFKTLEQHAPEKEIAQVEGIIYREQPSGKLVQTAPRAVAEDIDAFPWPDYEGFGYFDAAKRYATDDGDIGFFIVTSRSCPFRCTFCSRSGAKYRQRSLDAIFAELDYIVNNHRVTEINLSDELFAENPKRIYEFCERIKKYNVRWHVSLRVSPQVTPELLSAMKEANCASIMYGLESADNTVLKSMKKGITVEQMRQTLEITKASGIPIEGCNFIFGDTAETLETAANTLNWIRENSDIVETIGIGPILLMPGSDLYNKAVREGKLTDTVAHMERCCPPINVSKMSDDEYRHFINDTLPNFKAEHHILMSDIRKKRLQERLRLADDGARYLHEFTCDACGTHIAHTFRPELAEHQVIVCPKCGKSFAKNLVPLYLQSFEQEITNALRQENVALWGAGTYARYLYMGNTFFREHPVKMIDASPFKQQNGFNGKRVFAPDEVEALGIDAVISTLDMTFFHTFAAQMARQSETERLKICHLFQLPAHA